MIGTYKTIDDCIYEVFYTKPGKYAELSAKCIKSTVRTGPFASFPLLPGQMERNLKSNNWLKIEL